MAIATLISGRVKYAAGNPKDYGHGESINVVIAPTGNGEDIKVWGKLGDPIAHLKKGEQVTLTYDGRSYKLIATSPDQNGNGKATPPARLPDPDRWTEDHRARVFEELKRRAGILTCCHEEVRKRFLYPQTGEQTISEDTLQKYAVTLYLDLKEMW